MKQPAEEVSASVNQAPIIEAGLRALAEVDRAIDTILGFTPSPEWRGVISHGAIPAAVQSLCSNQALAYSCLFDDRKRPSENNKAAKLRVARVGQIKARCGDLQTPELRNRGVRNALVHFDERYLEAIIAYPTGNWVQDLAFSHRDVIDMGSGAERRMIRAYFFDIDTLYLFGDKLHLQTLKKEIAAICDLLGLRFEHSPAAPAG